MRGKILTAAYVLVALGLLTLNVQVIEAHKWGQLALGQKHHRYVLLGKSSDSSQSISARLGLSYRS